MGWVLVQILLCCQILSLSLLLYTIFPSSLCGERTLVRPRLCACVSTNVCQISVRHLSSCVVPNTAHQRIIAAEDDSILRTEMGTWNHKKWIPLVGSYVISQEHGLG